MVCVVRVDWVCVGGLCRWGVSVPPLRRTPLRRTARAAWASHDSPRTPNVHISGPRPSKTPPKFHERTPKREERKKIVAGEGKNQPSGLHLSAPHFFSVWAPHPSGPHSSAPHSSRPHLRRHVGLMRHWPKQVRPKQVNTFTGLNRSGQTGLA